MPNYLDSTSGGLSYAGLQKDGKIYIFDIDLSLSGSVSHIDTITPIPGYTDISGLYYSIKNNVLYAIFDTSNILLEMQTNGTVIAGHTLPGNAQEGSAAVVPSGYPDTAQVFIAEDTPPKVWNYGNYLINYVSN